MVVMARGAGTHSSMAEQKAEEQLGFRDEQDIFTMATHFPELLIGSVHVREPLFGTGRGRQEEWVPEIHGSPDL